MSGKLTRATAGCLFGLVVGLGALPLAGQKPRREECQPDGVWYGGSVVAYQQTIVPAGRDGHYLVTAEGMYKEGVLSTVYSGELVKRGDRYEGPIMQLFTADSTFLKPPPVGKMPDLNIGWGIIEQVDCNTLRNTIPFFGTYLAAGIWQRGLVWSAGGKRPLVDPPDVDLLNVLNGGKPIVETYHRLPRAVEPKLLHKDATT